MKLAESTVKFLKVISCLNMSKPLAWAVGERAVAQGVVADAAEGTRRVFYGHHNEDPNKCFAARCRLGAC